MTHSTINSFSLIIPCINDGDIIEKKLLLAEQLFNKMHLAPEIILVDDGSSDNTLAIIESIRHHIQLPFKVVSFPENRGKGAAIKAGIHEASKDIIFFTDSDLPYHFDVFSDSLNIFRTTATTVVIGSRLMHSPTIRNSPFRKSLSLTFSFYVNSILHLEIKDTQCGFKGFRKEWIMENISMFNSDGFAFDIELLAFAKAQNLEITQVPVRYMMPSRPSHINFVTDPFIMALNTIQIALNLKKLRKLEFDPKDIHDK